MGKILTGSNELQELCARAMAIANKRKAFIPDWTIVSVLRTAKEQWQLYVKGRDEWGRIMYINDVVTYANGYDDLSVHQSGDAVDFAPINDDGGIDWSNKAAFSDVANCFFEAAMDMGIRIRWGGHFTNIYDGGHIEIVR